MKWWIGSFIGIFLVGVVYFVYVLGFSTPKRSEEQPWLILYASNAKASKLQNYNPIIFDPKNHPPLDDLKKKQIAVFAHWDLANQFQEIANLEKEANLEPILNLMDTIVEEQIPSFFIEGFNGIFIDGLDEWTELQNILVQFILKLKIRFPSVPIIVQNAQSYLPEIGYAVNGYLVSSVTTTYDASTHEYRFIDSSLHNERVEQLLQIQKDYPNLTLFVLDFWDPSDQAAIKQIYSSYGQKPFRVYVGNKDLDVIVSVR